MDSRAQINIEFRIFGETFTWNGSINYFPDERSGVDPNLAEFFRVSYDKAKSAFDDRVYASRAAERAAAEEAEERATLARLQEKYPHP